MTSFITSTEAFMVAERAVGQAADDLRAEFGLKFQEVMGVINGVKNELDGELSSFRDDVSNAFKESTSTLRAEISSANETIQSEIVRQIKEYNSEIGTEIGKMLVENNKVIESKIQATDVETKLKESQEAIQKQMDLLEININESLDNIKKHGINHGGSGTRDNSKTTDNWNSKGNRYGFDKEYKLDATDRWAYTSTVGFRNFKLLAERYLLSAKPEYSEGLALLMKYAQHKDVEVDLKEKNGKDEFVHQEILTKVPNANELDTLLFNELMSMLKGELASARYIAQNVKRSGV